MDRVELRPKRRDIDYDQFVKRSALETDFSTLIREPTIFTYDGVPVIAYVRAPDEARDIASDLRRIEYQSSTRTGGLKTNSRVFGYQPRVALRRDYCTATSLASSNPDINRRLCDLGASICRQYSDLFPDVVERHNEMSEQVLDEWRMPGSVFTSGIINKNNPLKYHFDAGNFQNVCSCMLGYKSGTLGGYLSFPEYDLALEIGDNTLSMFDGQKILHGVTPIRALGQSAYRFTVVYYSLRGMWKCEPLEQEIARIRKVKQRRELKRAGLLDEAVVDQHGVRNE